jgi:hypothetical protein
VAYLPISHLNRVANVPTTFRAREEIYTGKVLTNNGLHYQTVLPFNPWMKMKILLPTFLAANLLLTASLFAETSTVSGQLIAVSTSSLTVKSGSDVWEIKRTETTDVAGTLRVNSIVTVKFDTADGQKKEGPGLTTEPTATPAGR